MTRVRILFILFLFLTIISCKVDPPDQQASAGGPAGAAARLTTTEFSKLDAQQQYQVANKLMGTLFKGVSPEDFFDLTAGTAELKVGAGKTILGDVEKALKKPLANPGAYLERISLNHLFVEERRATAESLAIIREYPLSKSSFEAWMAYVLANTILFSPAEEIDSADFVDVQKVYNKLVDRLAAGDSVREIVYKHMVSQENWRRFRSPEDNTREMIEIYLGLFDRDEDVPKASIACKNWYLTGEAEGYQLVVGLDENTEPQRIFDRWVTTCQEFYRAVADHPLVIPRIVTVLVDHFFTDSSSEMRADMVKSIVSARPASFHDIFTHIILSRTYLLKAERPKSLEETFFNLADRIHWQADNRFYRNLTNPSGNSSFPTLHNMKQPNMSLKLGRFAQQPLDSLSFAYYHQAIRERLLLDRKTNAFSTTDAGWQTEFLQQADFLSGDDFVNYLFVAVLGRKASTDELATLNAQFTAMGFDQDKLAQTMITLDYFSRLVELYYMKAIG